METLYFSDILPALKEQTLLGKHISCSFSILVQSVATYADVCSAFLNGLKIYLADCGGRYL